MADIGKAYVQIVPAATGISGKITKALEPEALSAGQKTGNAVMNGVSTGLGKVGGAMTNYITKPALAAATAIGGATIWKGWSRMTEIDNAKVKLEAIGNSATDVSKITDNALAAVKGTAYGLNEAMTSSASAVAAGIKPGQELTNYLKAISDAASVAGTDMGSMGTIFNKVAASGKAQNDVLGMLAEKGIPIYQYLADEMGTTADAVFDLAKDGQIGLTEFQNAITSHIGGAAAEIGSKTITGAISNLGASLSRIGANFLGSADDANSFAGKVLPMLNQLLENLGPVEEKAKELGAAFGEAVGGLIDFLSQIPMEVIAGVGAALVSIGPTLLGIAKVLPLISSAVAFLSTPLGAIVGVIGAVAAALALIYIKSESFRNAINGLVVSVAKAVMPLFPVLFSAFKGIVSAIMSIAKSIGSVLGPVVKVLTPIITAVVKILVRVAKVVITQFAGSFKVAAAVIKSAVTIVKTVVTTVGQLISRVWNSIKSVTTSVWNAIKTAITHPIQTAKSIISSVVKTIQSFLKFTGLGGVVRSVFNGIKSAITDPIGTAKNVISGIINAIKGFFKFKVTLPHIPLPHFTISPPGWKVGDLLKGKIPKLGISVYAKGGIVDDPTLGIFGEAGPEANIPLSGKSKMRPFAQAIADEMGGSGTVYNIGDVTLDVSELKDVATVEQLFTIVKRAKGLA